MGVGRVGIGQSSSIQTTNLADARTGSSDAEITKALGRILKSPADLLPTGSKNGVEIGRPIKKAELNRNLLLDDGVRDQLLQRVQERTKGTDWRSLPEQVKRDYVLADGLKDRLITASSNAQKAKTAPRPPLDLRAVVQWTGTLSLVGTLPLVGPQLRSLAANYLANQDPEAVLANVRREVDLFLQSKI
jgi:hypothetical protein